MKCIYIGFLNGQHVVYHFGKLYYAENFTTENPHKKETVFYKEKDQNYFDENVSKADLVIYHGSFIQLISLHKTVELTHKQLGDDLREAFEDSDNEMFIDLTK